MAALLQGKHLSKTYSIEAGVWGRAKNSVLALRDVSFYLEKSETLAVVGGSGCGKSTLARILAGLITPDSGDLLWDDQPLVNTPAPVRAQRIQMIFQDPYASLNPKLSIRTQLGEVVSRSASFASSGRTIEALSQEWLKRVGMPVDALDRYPFQFSGGQRQRIAIARALAIAPQVLIADEPLSALDVTIQAQILALFKELKAELNLTILFITHDLAIVPALADRMMVLQDGRVVEEGDPSPILRQPTHPYTQRLVAAIPRLPC